MAISNFVDDSWEKLAMHDFKNRVRKWFLRLIWRKKWCIFSKALLKPIFMIYGFYHESSKLRAIDTLGTNSSK